MTRVDVQLACDDPDVPDADRIHEWVSSALAAAELTPSGKYDVSVRVVDVAEMRALNRDFRDKDKPTNVLSFPGGDVAGLPSEETRVLGDVVICANIVRDEAAEQNKSLADHWAHMLVHGTLHLLGYDHISEEQATEMEGLEVSILTRLGVRDPYRVQ
jgi:probable rRNA maturation factor